MSTYERLLADRAHDVLCRLVNLALALRPLATTLFGVAFALLLCLCSLNQDNTFSSQEA